MFEEQIAQGRDMIRRLGFESTLSHIEKNALPSYRRVPIKEVITWQETIENKIRSNFTSDTFARYQSVLDIYEDELHNRAQGNDPSPTLNFWNRIVAYLEELNSRASTSSVPPDVPSVHVGKKANADISAQTYDIFISHASEDKEAIARPLYAALVEQEVKVWFDEATLELGDSLRRMIDRGLARCRYGIVILSPRFLQKEWPQRELDGLVARETASGEKAILPIWHGLDGEMLMRYSPTLADRLAAQSADGIPVLVDKILRVLKR